MTQMDKLHTLELQIALEVKRICEKNNIPYFITAGTLLGAERHGGFIPWDDDMDIGMLRNDYESFLEACKKDLNTDIYYLQNWNTDENFPFSFTKIRLKYTHIVEDFSDNLDEDKNGLFVDIFPFDNVPNEKIKQKIQSKKYFICKRLLWIKKGMGKNMQTLSLKHRLKYILFKCFSIFFKYEQIKEYFIKTQMKYNNLNTNKVVTDGSYSYEKESILKNWVDDLEYVKFETEEFLAFKSRTDYLKHFYGNYMELPPEDKRNRHQVKMVDFGIYDTDRLGDESESTNINYITSL